MRLSTIRVNKLRGPPTLGGKGWKLSQDSMTARVAGRLHTTSVTWSSMDECEAAQRTKLKLEGSKQEK